MQDWTVCIRRSTTANLQIICWIWGMLINDWRGPVSSRLLRAIISLSVASISPWRAPTRVYLVPLDEATCFMSLTLINGSIGVSGSLPTLTDDVVQTADEGLKVERSRWRSPQGRMLDLTCNKRPEALRSKLSRNNTSWCTDNIFASRRS